MKIATWNVNSIKVRLPQVLDWCKEHKPDVLALQETKVTDENFPIEACQQAGYQVQFSGQRTYNGVAILSKKEASDVATDIAGMDDPQRRILAATINGVRVINLYVPNGASVDSDKYVYKMGWLKNIERYISQQLSKYPSCVVLGDFNIAPTDDDVHDPEAWRGDVLVSPKERAAFCKLIALGLVDSFRMTEHHQVIYSWWDYRQAAFRRNRGLRIDHILASKAMAKRYQLCRIDKSPRGWERPSDHAPVWAVFV